MNFGSWDSAIHTDKDQVKRMATAKKAVTTPSAVDRETETAEFKGSGKVPYRTTLDDCTCRDFLVRHLPCKHMYRLAFELESSAVDTGVNKNELIKCIFALPASAQSTLYSLIDFYSRDWETISGINKRNSDYDVLFSEGLLIETAIDTKYIVGLDIHALKKFLAPFDICADILAAKVNQKRKYVCDWVINNEDTIIPMIKEYYVGFEFSKELNEIKKELYTRFRKKFIRELVPDEYWNGEIDEFGNPIMESDYENQRVFLREYFTQED